MSDTPSPTTRSPWWWVPSLYFAQGVPYVVVMTVAVIMFKRLGVPNTQIALYTSWLYLPYAIKPLWSPLVQKIGTRRGWVVVMQLLVAAGLACAAFAIPLDSFLRWSLVALASVAICSATHDIAADGFYLLALTSHQQAWFVGIRSTAYRMAMIAGQGLLVMLAGLLESSSGLPVIDIQVRRRRSRGNRRAIRSGGIRCHQRRQCPTHFARTTGVRDQRSRTNSRRSEKLESRSARVERKKWFLPSTRDTG